MSNPTSLPTVSVSAHARREVLPDSFVLRGRVSVRAETNQAAVTALVARYADLERAVDGLPDSVQIRHGSLSVWDERRGRAGWQADRTMSVEGGDLATVADVASALSSVQDVAVDGPYWQVSPDNPVYAELQADAVREARDRAERYASALGGSLGRLASLSDPGSGGGHWEAQAMSARGSAAGAVAPAIADLDLTPQELTVGAQVNATWYLVLPG